MKKVFSIVILLLFLTAIFPLSTTIGADENVDSNRDWTIINTYSIPESSSGLAWDGTYLYSGIYGSLGSNIYQIDPSDGSYSLLCTGPQEDAYGLSFDGTYFWTTDHPGSSSDPAIAIQFDYSGSEITQFDLPAHYMSGIGYDSGNFWVAAYYDPDGWLYRVDGTGTVLQNYAAPDNQPWDVCIENSNLWMADYWGDTIYKIDKATGNLLDSYATEGTDPAGIVWDGQYLWYCDNGAGGVDYLYQVDLGGSGTPDINVPSTNYNYGVVTVGTSETWNVLVQSVGTGDLIINDLTFTGAGSSYLSTTTTFPLTIPSGTNEFIPITFEPLDVGALNAIGTIESNDPVNPEVELTLTGNGVSSGPDIYLPVDNYNFGNVRTNSYTRWIMDIQNMGDSTLTITDISSSDSHFIIDPDISFPISIATLASEYIDIWFQAAIDGPYSATISISSNDGDENPYQAQVQATAVTGSYPIGSVIWDYTVTGGFDNSPKAIESLPDINGDGVNEVIVCTEDDYIRCFNGNDDSVGDPLWETEIYSGSLFMQQELAITEDIDSDGYEDIVVGTPYGDRSIITLSGKTGEQIWKHDTHEYGGGGWVYMVDCTYDYNGDTISDVLASAGDDGDGTGPKRAYCLDGLTGDTIWDCPLGGPVFAVIGVEDFTGDSIPDVIAGASNAIETLGTAYGINGNTGDVEWSFDTASTSVWALSQLSDITGDSVKDVIIGEYNGYGYYYAIDPTTGDEIYSNSINSQLILRFENLGDVNGDGYDDILPSHSGTIARVINGYTGAFVWSQSLADKSWCIDNAQDLTGDGINDVFIGTLYVNNKCYFLNGENGTVLHTFDAKAAVDAIGATRDILGDGSMEFVAGLRNGDIVVLSGGQFIQQPQPPIASFTYEPPNPLYNELIYFNSTSYDPDGYIVNWTWEMGDGTILYGEQVTHSYPENLTYQVNLTITDNESMIGMTSKSITIGLFEILDVEQTVHDRGFPIRHALDGDWAGAQNYTPTVSTITKCEIYLRKFGTPEFDLVVELREDSINGPLLDTITIPQASAPSTWTWLELDFNDVTVTPGVDYFIKCPPAPGGVTTSFGYEWGYAFGNQYDPGSFWFTRDGGGLWRDLPTMYEFEFRTYGYA